MKRVAVLACSTLAVTSLAAGAQAAPFRSAHDARVIAIRKGQASARANGMYLTVWSATCPQRLTYYRCTASGKAPKFSPTLNRRLECRFWPINVPFTGGRVTGPTYRSCGQGVFPG